MLSTIPDFLTSLPALFTGQLQPVSEVFMLRALSHALLLSGLLTALSSLPGLAQTPIPTPTATAAPQPEGEAELVVSPLVLEIDSDTGRGTGTLTVTNSGTAPGKVEAYTSPFTYSEAGEFQVLPTDPAQLASQDLTPYVEFAPKDLVIGPGETRQLRVITLLNPSLPNGEYRTAVFIQNPAQQTAEISGIQVIPRVAILVYLRKGELTSSLEALGASYNPEGNAVQLTVKNEGQRSLRPAAEWQLKQGGALVSAGSVTPRTVIQGSQRQIEIPLEGTLTAGTYSLEGQLMSDDKTYPFSVEVQVPSVQSATLP